MMCQNNFYVKIALVVSKSRPLVKLE